MSEVIMRRITPGITKPAGPIHKRDQACSVTTTDGLILKADTSYRPGDPIIGPDNRVHWVEKVHPPRALASAAPVEYRLW